MASRWYESALHQAEQVEVASLINQTPSADMDECLAAGPRSGTRGEEHTGAAEFPVPLPVSAMPAGYAQLIRSLKNRIRRSRIETARAVNQQLLLLYYSM